MWSPQGFLYVESQPGSQVTVEEYTDWYDNEHVPLRMEIPEFLTGRRYVSHDSQSPAYLATYEVANFSLFSEEKYAKLRVNRSAREGEIIKRLEALDRKTCETLWISSEPTKATEYFVSVVIVPEGDGKEFVEAWVKEGEGEVKAFKGYKRALKSKLVDGLRTGVSHDPIITPLPQFLAVYEFDSDTDLQEDKIKSALGLKDTKEVKIRVWKLYKEWETIFLKTKVA